MADAISVFVGEDPRVERLANVIREARAMGRIVLDSAAAGDSESREFLSSGWQFDETPEELTFADGNSAFVISQQTLNAYQLVLAAERMVELEEARANAVAERLRTEPLVTAHEVERLFELDERPVLKTFRRWLSELTPVEIKPKRYRRCDAIQICLRRNGNLRLKRDKEGH